MGEKSRGLTRCAAAAVVAVLLSSAFAAEPSAKRAFESVPRQALVELKATVGKPFSSGLVFIDGKYLAPPYKVERYGTAIRISGHQVTGQIIRWDEFLKTQPGARVEQPEASEDAEAPESDETESAPEVSPYDIDSLYYDEGASAQRTRTAAAKPAARKPAPVVVFEGQFKANEKTRAMVASINKLRSDIELALRKGGSCFFGTRYSMITADRGPTDMFLESMPLVMKDNNTFAAFSSAARAKGVTYLSESVMRDLFRNRLDYIRLQDRAKAIKEERKWGAILNRVP